MGRTKPKLISQIYSPTPFCVGDLLKVFVRFLPLKSNLTFLFDWKKGIWGVKLRVFGNFFY
jgi:hypothetical protein